MNVCQIVCLPLISVLAQPAAGHKALFLRGAHFVVYTVKAGETVRLDLTPRILKNRRSALPAYEVIDHRSAPALPKTVFDKPVSLSYKAAADGLNALVVTGHRNWYRVDSRGRPTMVCARQRRPLHFRGRDFPIYFLVPKDAKGFRLFITCPDRREGATLRVLDPDGTKVFEETDWYHKTRRVAIKAPPRHRGRVWSFRTANPREIGKPYSLDDVVVCFDAGIPPFVATDRGNLVAVLLASGEVDAGQVAGEF